jgi:hypothetical protein
MRRLSSLIVALVLTMSLFAQKSPHGDSFFVNCDDCHKTDGWKVNMDSITFDHGDTKFPLMGQHREASCKDCHKSLEFAKAETRCDACHSDIHEKTVGNECSRCHTPNSWIVTDISRIHQMSRFPLLGAHATADCKQCHTNLYSKNSTANPSLMRFDPLGVRCYDCHQNNYLATTRPNHKAGNYATTCEDCHRITSFAWSGAGINHSFFPLTGGHQIDDCNKCHSSGVFTGLSNVCSTCHQQDYNKTANPNHNSLGLSTDCKQCHTTSPGWKPAEYRDHDTRFPIYSGKHKGEWESCADCHTNPANYTIYSCIDCHEHSNQGKVDEEHSDVQGYTYTSVACYGCHPTGSSNGTFDHAAAGFPLQLGHSSVECSKCHTSGFAGTSPVCASCHTNTYNQTNNPKHAEKNISNECATCHTLNPGWKPALFPNHNAVYAIEGAHTTSSCEDCHNSNYNNTPNTCVGCHQKNYDQTTNPNHATAQFATTCADCHSQNAWSPATFDHDGQFFPVYSGKHKNTWTNCNECHTTPNNYAAFSCIDCHDHNKTDMDNKHQGISGYQYNSPACLSCHPDGSAANFDHAAAGFPLTGGHTSVLCSSCHTNGYAGTSPVCAGCHTPDYNQSLNPNHTAIGINNACAECHTLSPGWAPAAFPTHNNYYVIAGAHVAITNQCADCHNGNYNSTPNTCVGCHQSNYNQTTNPNHASAQFPTTCADCHTQTAWSPSTFNHDGQYFPIYSGKHKNQWNACSECHPNASNYAVYTCTTSCHPQNSTNNEHQGVGGYQYLSSACLACHPNGNAAGSFNHNTSPFPLTGGHAGVDCAQCHANGYAGTTQVCSGCHTPDYTSASNPNHTALVIPNTCETCHTTNPGWAPATFPIHNNYYVLAGAHVSTACADCHNGSYTGNTPNVCSGCHMNNYNQTTNPNHAAAQFPTTCETCHTQTAWTPSTFNHDGQYFPIYSGKHQGQWNQCADCHPDPSNFVVYTCTTSCHPQSSTNNQHQGVGGYQYVSSACLGCHPTGSSSGAFNHNTSPFPLTGGHASATCEQCHPNGYSNTSTVCSSCHMPDYNQSANPNHPVLSIPNTCETCHTTNPGWEPATFPIHNNYYALTGNHTTATCVQCHNGNYNTTPNTCSGCHMNNYNSTTNPNHTTAGFPTTCETCHTPSGWSPSTFDHGTVYPLTGAHTTVACAQCHTNGYSNTPNTCAGCHQNNYNTSVNPNHTALNIPNECATCHTTNPGWAPATFPIHNNYYVLAGAHVNAPCADCHSGNYTGSTPNTCAGCHMPDYNTTTNPNHASAQFPTTCADCHTQTAWNPSTFNHDAQYFPIYTGKHKNKWNLCSDCHPNASNFAVFTCTTSCHPQNSTNNNHQGVSGYQYNSNACYACHPTGNAGKSMLNGLEKSN